MQVLYFSPKRQGIISLLLHKDDIIIVSVYIEILFSSFSKLFGKKPVIWYTTVVKQLVDGGLYE